MTRPISVAERLEKYSREDPVTGCRIWEAVKIGGGYGRIRVNGRTMLAHRAAYECFVGPIPPGRFVLHLCDEPRCIAIAHLSLGTHTDNMRDRELKGRGNHRKTTHCPQGHERNAENAYYIYRKDNGRRQVKCRVCTGRKI